VEVSRRAKRVSRRAKLRFPTNLSIHHAGSVWRDDCKVEAAQGETAQQRPECVQLQSRVGIFASSDAKVAELKKTLRGKKHYYQQGSKTEQHSQKESKARSLSIVYCQLLSWIGGVAVKDR
jgi:hypothetical protein